MDAELVEYELERAGIPFSARRVDTREAFLHELAELEPDLILSDYTLPGFDGMSALSLARQLVPSVPFLIVTGSVNEETAVSVEIDISGRIAQPAKYALYVYDWPRADKPTAAEASTAAPAE